MLTIVVNDGLARVATRSRERAGGRKLATAANAVSNRAHTTIAKAAQGNTNTSEDGKCSISSAVAKDLLVVMLVSNRVNANLKPKPGRYDNQVV